jgi:hypothetical protein
VVTTTNTTNAVISAGPHGCPVRANRLITKLSVDLLQTHRLIHARYCENKAQTQRKAQEAADAKYFASFFRSSASPAAASSTSSTGDTGHAPDQQTNVRSQQPTHSQSHTGVFCRFLRVESR